MNGIGLFNTVMGYEVFFVASSHIVQTTGTMEASVGGGMDISPEPYVEVRNLADVLGNLRVFLGWGWHRFAPL
jgi:hypothetical protein